MGEFRWMGIAEGCWLLLEDGVDPDGGVIRAYVLGIRSAHWIWKGPGAEGRATSLGKAMAEARAAVEQSRGD